MWTIRPQIKGRGSNHAEAREETARQQRFYYQYELERMFAQIKADRCDSRVGHYSFRAIKSNTIYISFCGREAAKAAAAAEAVAAAAALLSSAHSTEQTRRIFVIYVSPAFARVSLRRWRPWPASASSFPPWKKDGVKEEALKNVNCSA